MAVLNYICVTSAATPTSPEYPNPSVADPRQTKIILRNKKPMKWSSGAPLGEYGGPPTTSKLRKYWGGGEEDPLASDDFMWNKDFVGRFKRLILEPQSSIEAVPAKEEPFGFLSFNRVMSLDSLEVDLGKELSAPINHDQALEIEATTENSGSERVKSRLAPTRREQDKWDRATKASTGGGITLVLACLGLCCTHACSEVVWTR